jgi:DNA repair exonuclease SbcCD ATPase subunit
MTDETTSVDDAGTEGATDSVDTTSTEASPTGGMDLSRIEQRMAELAEANQTLAQQQAEIYSHVTAEPEEPEWEPEPGDDGYDEWEAEQQLTSFVDQRAEEIARRMVEPMQRERAEQQWHEGLQRIEQMYPDLTDPAKARPVVEHATQLADELKVDVNHPGFAKFIELAYLANQARQAQAGQVPAGGQGPFLETGGGAAPSAGQEEDPEERFIKSLEKGRSDFL